MGRFTVDTKYDRRTRSWVTAVTGPTFDVFDLDGNQVPAIYSGTKEGAAVAQADRVAEMEALEAALRSEEQNDAQAGNDYPEPTNESTERTITVDQLETVLEAVGKFRNRALRLGMTEEQAPRVEIVTTFRVYDARDVDGDPVTRPYPDGLEPEDIAVGTVDMITFRIVSEPVRWDGWRFVAVLEAVQVLDGDNPEVLTGNLYPARQHGSGYVWETAIRRLPDAVLPEGKYTKNTDASICDHCGKRRNRAQTFIVQHTDGRTMQVGRSCLRDFTGGTSAERMYDLLRDLFDTSEAWSFDPYQDYDGIGGGNTARIYDVYNFVLAAHITARKNGLVTRKQAKEWNHSKVATADQVQKLFIDKPATELRSVINSATDDDKAFVVAAMNWAFTLNDTSDFNISLRQAVRMGHANPKTSGILAYLPAAYNRHIGTEVERKAKANTVPSEFQGFVGEKINRNLTVTFQRYFETQFGSSQLVVMEDDKGNKYKWWTSGREVKVGYRADIKATVKGHDVDRADNVTVLTRVTPLKGTDWVQVRPELEHGYIASAVPEAGTTGPGSRAWTLTPDPDPIDMTNERTARDIWNALYDAHKDSEPDGPADPGRFSEWWPAARELAIAYPDDAEALWRRWVR